MPTTKRKNRKHPVLIAALILVLLALGYFTYAEINSLWPFQGSSETKQVTTQSTDSDASQSSSSTSNDDDPSSPTNKAPKQYQGEGEATSNKHLTGSINYKQVVDDTLSIRVTITQKVTTGTCRLTLQKQGSTVTVKKSTDIVTNPSSSTCAGFDMPTSELSSGTWNITIDLSSGNDSGKITGTVTI